MTLVRAVLLAVVVCLLRQGPEERCVMLLLEKPRTGIARIGTYGVLDAPETNISIGLYFYGDEAGQQAVSSEPIWQSWFADTLAARNISTSGPNGEAVHQALVEHDERPTGRRARLIDRGIDVRHAHVRRI